MNRLLIGLLIGLAGVVTWLVVPSSAERPRIEVRVFVLDDSGINMAGEVQANVLRGLGYQVVGIGKGPKDRGPAVVLCKAGYEAESRRLVLALPRVQHVLASGPIPEVCGDARATDSRGMTR